MQTQRQVVLLTVGGQVVVVAITLIVLGLYALHYDGAAAAGIIQTLQEVILTSGLVTGVVSGIHVWKQPAPATVTASAADPNAVGGQPA